VEARELMLSLEPGSLSICASAVAATGFVAAGAAGSDYPSASAPLALLSLPLADLPILSICLAHEWQLPAGRAAAEHHLFPPPSVHPETLNPSP
jgi:hypothetical protein